MGKYIIQWTSMSVVFGFLLYITIALITKTTYVYVFEEFEIVLILTGISILLSTIIICTKLILDKISKLK